MNLMNKVFLNNMARNAAIVGLMLSPLTQSNATIAGLTKTFTNAFPGYLQDNAKFMELSKKVSANGLMNPTSKEMAQIQKNINNIQSGYGKGMRTVQTKYQKMFGLINDWNNQRNAKMYMNKKAAYNFLNNQLNKAKKQTSRLKGLVLGKGEQTTNFLQKQGADFRQSTNRLGAYIDNMKNYGERGIFFLKEDLKNRQESLKKVKVQLKNVTDMGKNILHSINHGDLAQAKSHAGNFRVRFENLAKETTNIFTKSTPNGQMGKSFMDSCLKEAPKMATEAAKILGRAGIIPALGLGFTAMMGEGIDKLLKR